MCQKAFKELVTWKHLPLSDKKRGGLESCGRRLISLHGKTKKISACCQNLFPLFRCLKEFFFGIFKPIFRFIDFFLKLCDGVLSSLFFPPIYLDLQIFADYFFINRFFFGFYCYFLKLLWLLLNFTNYLKWNQKAVY